MVMVIPEEATDRFEAETAPFRRELVAHCYRMTGSVHEAEDLLQETYLRAWRAFQGFEGRSSVRTWMYRIATNVCLTFLDRRRSRPLPSGLGAPSSDPDSPVQPAPDGVQWIEPVPDHLVVDEGRDPAEVVMARQRVRLALVAGLQVLPARQRAAFVLGDTLALPAAEVAEMLGVSIAAAKSLLQRARRKVAQLSLTEDDLAEPHDQGARRVLDGYIAAFEQSDSSAIERLLADHAVLEMTGTSTWFSGKGTCLPFIAKQAIGDPGDWLMTPLRANGQLGAGAYQRSGDGAYLPFAVVVLATTSTTITRISLFMDRHLFSRFGLPPTRSGNGVG
jgi:RNA polymerase sigma-70 factor (ECF subfamily)